MTVTSTPNMEHKANKVNHPKVGRGHPRLTVTEAARRLGVTREHLSRVLHGRRQSPPLLARYEVIRSQHQNN